MLCYLLSNAIYFILSNTIVIRKAEIFLFESINSEERLRRSSKKGSKSLSETNLSDTL